METVRFERPEIAEPPHLVSCVRPTRSQADVCGHAQLRRLPDRAEHRGGRETHHFQRRQLDSLSLIGLCGLMALFPQPALILYFALSLSTSIIGIFRSPKRVSKEIDCPGPKGNITIRAESLPFSEIPGQSRLFIEYQNDPESLRRFYPNAVRSHTQIF